MTVLRAHLLDERRLERLLSLQRQTGVHLTLVVHRPRLTAALTRALATTGRTIVETLPEARVLYYGSGTRLSCSPPSAAPAPWRWSTLDALDRLVSYDSPRPCATACVPRPIVYQQRPAPSALSPAQSAHLANRLHAATPHPTRAAALAAAVVIRASFQQLVTARADGFDHADGPLTLHDQARYTDGCAVYPVPACASSFLPAAVRYAQLTGAAFLLAAQLVLYLPGSNGVSYWVAHLGVRRTWGRPSSDHVLRPRCT
ncbi:hypothetical protein AB0D66_33355 [Streptomyces sp. NPDC048270]|uniref:hypothetical protein n=1 Tax=Streptomyces sp. NPDC048270 TaxID=3154615 RepID=UPI0033E8AC61